MNAPLKSMAVRERALSAALGETYVRDRDAVKLLGNMMRPAMRPTGPLFFDDPILADDEVLLCSAFICAFRRKLAATDETLFPMLRKLRAAIEGEVSNLRKCLAHIELMEG